MEWRIHIPAILFLLLLRYLQVATQGQFNLQMLRQQFNAGQRFPQQILNNRFQNFNPQHIIARNRVLNSSPNLQLPNNQPRIPQSPVQAMFPRMSIQSHPQIGRPFQQLQHTDAPNPQLHRPQMIQQAPQTNSVQNVRPDPNHAQKQLQEFQRLQVMLRHIQQQRQRQQQQQQQQQRRQQLIQQIQAIQRSRAQQNPNAQAGGANHASRINQMEKMIRDMMKYRDQLKKEAAFRQKTRQIAQTNMLNKESIPTADVQSGPSILVMSKDTVTEIPVTTTKKPNGSHGQSMIVFAKTANIHSNVDSQNNVQMQPPEQPQEQLQTTTTRSIPLQNTGPFSPQQISEQIRFNSINEKFGFLQQQQQTSQQQNQRFEQQHNAQEIPPERQPHGNIQVVQPQNNLPEQMHQSQQAFTGSNQKSVLPTESKKHSNQNVKNRNMQPLIFNEIHTHSNNNHMSQSIHQGRNEKQLQNINPSTRFSNPEHQRQRVQPFQHGNQNPVRRHNHEANTNQHMHENVPMPAPNQPTQLDLPPLTIVNDIRPGNSNNNRNFKMQLPTLGMISTNNQRSNVQADPPSNSNDLQDQNGLMHRNQIQAQSNQNMNNIPSIAKESRNRLENVQEIPHNILYQTTSRPLQNSQNRNELFRNNNAPTPRINRQLFKRPPRPRPAPTTQATNVQHFIPEIHHQVMQPEIHQTAPQTLPPPITTEPPQPFIQTTPRYIPSTTPNPSFNNYFNRMSRRRPEKVRISFRRPSLQRKLVLTPPPVITTQPSYTTEPVISTQPNYHPEPTEIPNYQQRIQQAPSLPPPLPTVEQLNNFQINRAHNMQVHRMTTEVPNIRFHTTTVVPSVYQKPDRNFQNNQNQRHNTYPGQFQSQNINQNQIHNNNNHPQQTTPVSLQLSHLQRWESERKINNNGISNVNQQPESRNPGFQRSIPITTTEKPRILPAKSQQRENPLAKLLKLLQRKSPSIKFASERQNSQRPPQAKATQRNNRRNRPRPTRPQMQKRTQSPRVSIPDQPIKNSYPFNGHAFSQLPKPTQNPVSNRWSRRTMPTAIPATSTIKHRFQENFRRFEVSPFSTSFPLNNPRRHQTTRKPSVQNTTPAPTPVKNNLSPPLPSSSRRLPLNRNIQANHRNRNSNPRGGNPNRLKMKSIINPANPINPAQLLIAALIQALQSGNLIKQLQEQQNRQFLQNSQMHSSQQNQQFQEQQISPQNSNQGRMDTQRTVHQEQNIPERQNTWNQNEIPHQLFDGQDQFVKQPQVTRSNSKPQSSPPKDMPDLSMLQGQEVEFTDVNTGFGGESPPPVIIQRIPKKSRSNSNGNSNGVSYEFPTMALHENSAVVVQTQHDDNDDFSNSTLKINGTLNSNSSNVIFNEDVDDESDLNLPKLSTIFPSENILKSTDDSHPFSKTTTPMTVTHKLQLPMTENETTGDKKMEKEFEGNLGESSDFSLKTEDKKSLHMLLPSMASLLPEVDYPESNTPPPLFVVKKDRKSTSPLLDDAKNNYEDSENVVEEPLSTKRNIKDDMTTQATEPENKPTTIESTSSKISTTESITSPIPATTSSSIEISSRGVTTDIRRTTEVNDEFESISTIQFPISEPSKLMISDDNEEITTQSFKSTTTTPRTESTRATASTKHQFVDSTTQSPMPTIKPTTIQTTPKTTPFISTTLSSILTSTKQSLERKLFSSTTQKMSDDFISSTKFSNLLPAFDENIDSTNEFPKRSESNSVHVHPKTTEEVLVTSAYKSTTNSYVPSLGFHDRDNFPTTALPQQTTTRITTTEKFETTSTPFKTTTPITTGRTDPLFYPTTLDYRRLYPELFGLQPILQGPEFSSLVNAPMTTSTQPLETTTTRTTTTAPHPTTFLPTTTVPSTTTPMTSTTRTTTTTPQQPTTKQQETKTLNPVKESYMFDPSFDTMSFTFPTTIDYRDLFAEMFGRKPAPIMFNTEEEFSNKQAKIQITTTKEPVVEENNFFRVQKATYVANSLEDPRMHIKSTNISPTSSAFNKNSIKESSRKQTFPNELTNIMAENEFPASFVSNSLNGGLRHPQKVSSTTPSIVKILGRDMVRTTAQSLSARQTQGQTENRISDFVQDSNAGRLSQMNLVQPSQQIQGKSDVSLHPTPQSHFDVVDIPYNPNLDRAATLLSGSKVPNQVITPKVASTFQTPVENSVTTEPENVINLDLFSTNSLAASPSGSLAQQSNSVNDIADVSTQLDSLLSALGSNIIIHEQKGNDGHVQYKIEGGNKDIPAFVLRTGYKWDETLG